MNRDHFRGYWNQFKGDLKRQWGKFTDDDLLEIEGNYDKFVGKLQERYAEKKDEVNKWVDRWYQQCSSEHAAPMGGPKKKSA